MKNFRHRVEQRFEDFARCVYRHRIKTTIIMLVLMVTIISQIPKITIDNTQFAASLTGIFQGWDVAFYIADICAQNGYISATSLFPTTRSEFKYPRINRWDCFLSLRRSPAHHGYWGQRPGVSGCSVQFLKSLLIH